MLLNSLCVFIFDILFSADAKHIQFSNIHVMYTVVEHFQKK